MSFSSNPPLQINQLSISQELPPTYEQAHEILSLLLKRIVDAVNTKEGSLFTLQEVGNFDQYYILNDSTIFRNVYRYVFDMVAQNGGAIGPGATVSVLHGIVGLTKLTRMYGGAKNSDPTPRYIPLPYVSVSAVTEQVEVYITDTNIVLINGATQTALTDASLVIEYTKQ